MDEKIEHFRNDRKAQISVWVILGVVLFSSILIFILLSNKVTIPKGVTREDSVFELQSFLDDCTRSKIYDAVNLMLPQGGFIEPKNFVFLNDTNGGENIEFTCKNNGFYKPCIQQHPVLIKEMENEVSRYIQPYIERCFVNMKDEFNRRGSETTFEDNLSISVDFVPDRIRVNMKKNVHVVKEGEIRDYTNYEVVVSSNIYGLSTIAMEIAAQEAEYCYFEYVGYSILYPRYDIRKFVMSDPVKIYTIKDKKSDEKMNIAIRGCAIPAGL